MWDSHDLMTPMYISTNHRKCVENCMLKSILLGLLLKDWQCAIKPSTKGKHPKFLNVNEQKHDKLRIMNWKHELSHRCFVCVNHPVQEKVSDILAEYQSLPTVCGHSLVLGEELILPKLLLSRNHVPKIPMSQ